MTDRAALRDRIVALYLLDKGAYADVVDAAIDLIRAEVLKEAARVVMEEREKDFPDLRTAAAAILALKGEKK